MTLDLLPFDSIQLPLIHLQYTSPVENLSARAPPPPTCMHKTMGAEGFLIQVFLPKVSDVDFYAKTYRKPELAVAGV